MATATASAARPPSSSRRVASRARRRVTKAPVEVFLILVGILWLATIGLFLTSPMPVDQIETTGWWTIISTPSRATFENYREVFANDTITDSLLTTLWIHRRDAAPDLRRGARSLRLRVARVPRPRLALPRGHRAARRPAADGADPDLLALQHRRDLRHGDRPRPLPYRVRAPVRDLPPAELLIGIPKDLLEAARIDGASEVRIFFKLMLLALPAIAALAIFQFLWVWNDFLVALTFARQVDPITVAIFSQMRSFSTNVELIAPAAFISLAIPLVVFFAFQRYFVQGLLAGSVKELDAVRSSAAGSPGSRRTRHSRWPGSSPARSPSSGITPTPLSGACVPPPSASGSWSESDGLPRRRPSRGSPSGRRCDAGASCRSRGASATAITRRSTSSSSTSPTFASMGWDTSLRHRVRRIHAAGEGFELDGTGVFPRPRRDRPSRARVAQGARRRPARCPRVRAARLPRARRRRRRRHGGGHGVAERARCGLGRLRPRREPARRPP